MDKLRVLRVVEGTSVDGPGLRTSIYFAGCDHRCPGCHNPSSWSFDGGEEVGMDALLDTIVENDFNVTLSGGDPLYQIDGVVELCKKVRALGKTIWCYTGFTYEQVAADSRMSEILRHIDVLVDGPFVESLRNLDLRFRGSSNQRLIDVARSSIGKIVLYKFG